MEEGEKGIEIKRGGRWVRGGNPVRDKGKKGDVRGGGRRRWKSAGRGEGIMRGRE